MKKVKSKKYKIEIEATIENYTEDETDSLEYKKNIIDTIRAGLNFDETFGGLLGNFKTRFQKLKVKLIKKDNYF